MRPDPRAEGDASPRAERARSVVDALGSSLPETPVPDRAQRIDTLVKELARCGPENDGPVRRRLLAFGSDSIAPLCRAFPGALWIDLARPHRPLRSAKQLSAIAACLIEFGEPAAPYVARLLRSPRAEVRLAAALVASDLAHGSLVRPLANRLHDEVPLVANAAMHALRASALLPDVRELRAELLETLDDADSPEKWRLKAVVTLGKLRDAEALPALIEQLARERDVASAARAALCTLTGRDLGRFRLRWRAWLRRHGKRTRAEWLIEALEHDNLEQRLRAFDELVLLTGEGFDRRHAVHTREGALDVAAHFRKLGAAP